MGLTALTFPWVLAISLISLVLGTAAADCLAAWLDPKVAAWLDRRRAARPVRVRMLLRMFWLARQNWGIVLGWRVARMFEKATRPGNAP